MEWVGEGGGKVNETHGGRKPYITSTAAFLFVLGQIKPLMSLSRIDAWHCSPSVGVLEAW